MQHIISQSNYSPLALKINIPTMIKKSMKDKNRKLHPLRGLSIKFQIRSQIPNLRFDLDEMRQVDICNKMMMMMRFELTPDLDEGLHWKNFPCSWK